MFGSDPEFQPLRFLKFSLDNILIPLNEKREEIFHESTHRRIISHLDNYNVHNSKCSTEKMNEFGFHRAPYPPYSPDIAPSDFFLFGYVKNFMIEKAYKIVELLYSISPKRRMDASEEWIQRCNWISKK